MMFKKLRNYFASGLFILAPFFLTLVFISWLVKLADGFVVNPVFRLLPMEFDADSKIIVTKLIIAVSVVVFVTLLGIAAQKFIFRKLMETGETFISGIPLFSKVYLWFKEISHAFMGEKVGIFKRVVFFEYPRKGLYAMGFVTQDKKWELCDKVGLDLLSVFVPSPPNPATGFFIFVPREELIETTVTVEEGIKMIISGGAALPPQKT
jgi:uncharacterized membrane protein